MFSKKKDLLQRGKAIKKNRVSSSFQTLRSVIKNYISAARVNSDENIISAGSPCSTIRTYLREAEAHDVYANDFLLFLRQKQFDKYKCNQRVGIYDAGMLSLDIGNQHVNDLLPEKEAIILNNTGKKSIRLNMISEGNKVIAFQYYLGNRKSHFSVLNTSLNHFFAKAAYSSDLSQIMDIVRFIIKHDKNSIIGNDIQSKEIIMNKEGKQMDSSQAKCQEGFYSIGVILNPKHTYSTTYQVVKLVAYQFIRDGNNQINKKKSAKLFKQMIKCKIESHDMFYAISRFYSDHKQFDFRSFLCYMEDCLTYIVSRKNDSDIVSSLEKMSIATELQKTRVESLSTGSMSYTTSSSASLI